MHTSILSPLMRAYIPTYLLSPLQNNGIYSENKSNTGGLYADLVTFEDRR